MTPGARPRAHLVYAIAFGALVLSVVVLGIGSLALLRSGSDLATSTTLFWASIVLSILAVAAAAIVVLRSRGKG